MRPAPTLEPTHAMLLEQLKLLDHGRPGAYHAPHLLPGVVEGVVEETPVDVDALVEDGLVEVHPTLRGTYGEPLVRITREGRRAIA
ncbi:MAG: hypothetical protein GXY23_03260 [Myxococcales bacterium]|mgnify:CR=1 FL=1|jgi:hypothetical protein|nr:hypothetical protein [Myxococcales bacterium]